MAVAFTVPHDVFRLLVDRVDRIVERRNTIPILGNVIVRGEGDGRISVTGTDLDLVAEASSPAGAARVTAAGATTVPSALLKSILAKCEGEIAFSAGDEGRATLAAGRSRFKLHQLPVDDVPAMKPIEDPVVFDLPAADLVRIWKSVGFAISTEETRYYLNGIHLHRHAETGDLVSVATDGHRLAYLAQTIGPGEASDLDERLPAVIVPRKTCREFEAIAGGAAEGENVAVRVSDRLIEFETAGFRLTSKLVDGTFPDYRRVIPTANAVRAMLDPRALAEAVDRVSTVSAERGRAVKFAFAGQVLTLTVAAPDAGDAQDEIATGPHDGDDPEIEIGFNGRYVLDALATFDEARILFEMHDPGSPTLLQAHEGARRLVVLMPMRV